MTELKKYKDMKEKFILFKINKLEKAKLEKKNQRTKAVK